MRGDARLQAVEELVEPQRHEVRLIDPRRSRLGALTDPFGFFVRRQPNPGLPQPPHALVAPRPAEHEVDRRQHALSLQDLDDLLATRCVDTIVTLPRAVPRRRSATVGSRSNPHLLLIDRNDVRVGQEHAVLFDVHRMESPTDQVVMLERHGPLLLDHDARLTAKRPDPFTELLGVGDRRGQTDDPDRSREMDQHLLPDGAPVRILQVVDLVHHDPLEPVQRVAPLVQHVSEHLGGHHDDRCLSVDRVVPGQQSDLLGTVRRDEITELLVGQGFQRRRVETLAPGGDRLLDGELRDDGLARSRGRRDEDGSPFVQRLDRPQLEPIERERVARREGLRGDHVSQCRGGSASYGSTPLRSRWVASNLEKPVGSSRFDRCPAPGSTASWAPGI